jgi:hypothetical protein
MGLIVAVAWGGMAWAATVTREQAAAAAAAWVGSGSSVLGEKFSSSTTGTPVKRADSAGAFSYYVVPVGSGMAVVPGDDRIEPILCFTSDGSFDFSENSPLRALVERDLKGRFSALKSGADASAAEAAQARWAALTSGSSAKAGVSTVSDVRVAALVQSKWNQDQAYSGGPNCYNYYTPNNYYCGCVATAMAQVMRFHQYPVAGIGTASHAITVDKVDATRTTRGGDGAGGAYVWSSMVLDPDGSRATLTDAQCAAIGALTYDAGVAANMNYASSASGTSTSNARNALVNTFKYANAIFGFSGAYGTNISGSTLRAMINPGLDAGMPVILGLTQTSDGSGHEIVCDGYGYQGSTPYHHLNMGWGGSEDLWYNLPTIDSGSIPFNVIDDICYNILPAKTGEIVSGRLVDSSNNPVSGATVTAASGGGTVTATTDAKGIYALVGLASNTAYTISFSSGQASLTVTTGQSGSSSTATGNVWLVESGGGTPTPTVAPSGGGGGGGCDAFGLSLLLLPVSGLLLIGRRGRK